MPFFRIQLPQWKKLSHQLPAAAAASGAFPLGASLIHSAANQAGTGGTWKQILLIVSHRGREEEQGGQKDTVQDGGDSCHLTATGGSVTSHQKTVP